MERKRKNEREECEKNRVYGRKIMKKERNIKHLTNDGFK